jgi:hypothetical protein
VLCDFVEPIYLLVYISDTALLRNLCLKAIAMFLQKARVRGAYTIVTSMALYDVYLPDVVHEIS